MNKVWKVFLVFISLIGISCSDRLDLAVRFSCEFFEINHPEGWVIAKEEPDTINTYLWDTYLLYDPKLKMPKGTYERDSLVVIEVWPLPPFRQQASGNSFLELMRSDMIKLGDKNPKIDTSGNVPFLFYTEREGAKLNWLIGNTVDSANSMAVNIHIRESSLGIISKEFIEGIIATLKITGRFDEVSNKSPLAVENLKGVSGLSSYIAIYKNSARIDFEISRPDKRDTSVLLCIAGAFTTLDKYEVDGLYLHKGRVYNRNKINNRLGGAIKIINGECVIFPTDRGKIFSDSLISEIASQKGSLFQQIQMVENGKAATFKDSVLFQRRGIAIFKNGKTAVVESTKPITLKTFAEDMVAAGVKDLLYTDMGAWDEGWLRNQLSDEIIKLGMDHSQTGRQCNWVVFKK